MVAVYEAFTAPDFAELVERYVGRIVQPVAGQIVQTATAQLPVPGKVQSATGQIVPSVTAQNRADAASIHVDHLRPLPGAWSPAPRKLLGGKRHHGAERGANRSILHQGNPAMNTCPSDTPLPRSSRRRVVQGAFSLNCRKLSELSDGFVRRLFCWPFCSFGFQKKPENFFQSLENG